VLLLKQYFSIQKDSITFLRSHRKVALKDIEDVSIEVSSLPTSVDGVIFGTVLENEDHLFANESKFVDICLKIDIKSQDPEIIVLNDRLMTKNNPYYREIMKEAKELQKNIYC
jgi:predicted transposase YdaD